MAILRWFPAIAWAGFIFVMSSQPPEELPPWQIPFLDKLVHAGLFAILALAILFALWRSFPQARWKAAALAFALTLLYGMTDEWHQGFTPGRDVDPWDWVADAAGASAALVGTRFMRERRPAPLEAYREPAKG